MLDFLVFDQSNKSSNEFLLVAIADTCFSVNHHDVFLYV